MSASRRHVVVVGGGFCGLAAAWQLGRRGIRATVVEADAELGGLAGSFMAGGARLEKFYHHWFTSDTHVMGLIAELGLSERVLRRSSRTGMYYANQLFKLSTPVDLLRFSPLPLIDRIRLGLLTLRARAVRDWSALEDRTAADWLRKLGGARVYDVVWAPLLRGKFGEAAEDVAAVWFWNKLKLRGGSRGKGGDEQLAYFRGGFAALAEAMAEAIRAAGGSIRTGLRVDGIDVRAGRAAGVCAGGEHIAADAVIATPALPIIAELMAPHVPDDYVRRLRRIRYLANLCVVLELDRPLSDLYWMNVNDPSFPFVGVIEHTNFEPSSTYAGRHVAYLSRYLPVSDPMYAMSDAEVRDFTLGHLSKMFPDLRTEHVLATHVWRAQYAQPVVERGYRGLIPDMHSPLKGCYIATMAQIYPEDRGTNYAIRQGIEAAQAVARGTLVSLKND